MRETTKRLKMAILTGELKPRERLVESDLIERFHVKRFTARKVIHELASLGFAELVPNKGARVADFSDKEVEDIYRVRMSLEYLVADLAIQTLTPEKLARIKRVQKEYVDAMNRGVLEDVVVKNEEFHHTFYEMSDNKFLAEHLEKLTNSIFSLRYSAFFLLGVVAMSIDNHQAIIDAIEAKDLERLRDVLKESIILPKMIYASRKMGTVQNLNEAKRNDDPKVSGEESEGAVDARSNRVAALAEP